MRGGGFYTRVHNSIRRRSKEKVCSKKSPLWDARQVGCRIREGRKEWMEEEMK